MKAKIIVNKNYQTGEISKYVYGSFLEHLGRAVYGGVYEPGHPTADKNGFRQDVLELVKELGVTTVRYPGGNFVSGYDWQDGIGPKESRPSRLELSRKVVETNQFGTDEFLSWCSLAHVEPMLAVNLGTAGAKEAGWLVEYCNHPKGTYFSDLRRRNGSEKPYGVKLWCLGNEMDGFWQIGSKSAEDYGKLACEAAKIMKWVDPSIQLIVCGSSGIDLPSYGYWEETVLEYTYDYVDYISLHFYVEDYERDTLDFLAKSRDMEQEIQTMIGLCDYIKGRRHSDKTMYLSFDEWNVWYHSREKKNLMAKNWPETASLLEEDYTFTDALAVGCMLLTILRHADRIKIACLAQLVNVLAPIMTTTGGEAWRESIFYPFAQACRYGKGSILQEKAESPVYDSSHHKTVPYLESVSVWNGESRELVVFAVNRHMSEHMELSVEAENFSNLILTEYLSFKENEITRKNVFSSLPPLSWNVIRYRESD